VRFCIDDHTLGYKTVFFNNLCKSPGDSSWLPCDAGRPDATAEVQECARRCGETAARVDALQKRLKVPPPSQTLRCG